MKRQGVALTRKKMQHRIYMLTNSDIIFVEGDEERYPKKSFSRLHVRARNLTDFKIDWKPLTAVNTPNSS